MKLFSSIKLFPCRGMPVSLKIGFLPHSRLLPNLTAAGRYASKLLGYHPGRMLGIVNSNVYDASPVAWEDFGSMPGIVNSHVYYTEGGGEIQS